MLLTSDRKTLNESAGIELMPKNESVNENETENIKGEGKSRIN